MNITEPFAQEIFLRATHDGRCAELLGALMDGGSITIDRQNHKLVIAPGDVFQKWIKDQEEET